MGKKRYHELLNDELPYFIKNIETKETQVKGLNMTSLKNVTKLLEPGLSVLRLRKRIIKHVLIVLQAHEN